VSVSHIHQVHDLGVARGVFTATRRAHYGRDYTASTQHDLSTILAILIPGRG
jgi:hypothetical protein